MCKSCRRALLILLAIGAAAIPSSAHVGSPDVYLEGKAGPYQLFVTVRPPSVIPGVAALEVRSESSGMRELKAVPLLISSVGAKFAPVPDKLAVSKEDAQYFTGSLWIMTPGSWQVRISAEGDKGKGVLSVPLPSAALTTKKMQPGLGVLLSLLGVFLVGGLAAITGASVREAKLPAGIEVSPESNHRGKIATIVAVFVIGGVLWCGNAWWNSEASSYRNKVYKPLQMQAHLNPSGELRLNLNDPGWLVPPRRVNFRQVLFTRSVDDLIPDHNHLMHLYAIRQPGLDVVYHLHPELIERGQFRLNLHSMEPGDYKLYADVVHRNGFPETLVSSVSVPTGMRGREFEGDDAGGQAVPYTEGSVKDTSFRLRDGYRMEWLRPTQDLRAKRPELFRFWLIDPNGKDVRDMSFYMGMLGHAAFVKTDGSVFAHIHPAGSISMAAFALAQKQTAGDSKATAGRPVQPAQMDGTDMSGMNMSGMQHGADVAFGALPNEVVFPYGFPAPGRYRIFVQMKHGGIIETGIFDAEVKL